MYLYRVCAKILFNDFQLRTKFRLYNTGKLSLDCEFQDTSLYTIWTKFYLIEIFFTQFNVAYCCRRKYWNSRMYCKKKTLFCFDYNTKHNGLIVIHRVHTSYMYRFLLNCVLHTLQRRMINNFIHLFWVTTSLECNFWPKICECTSTQRIERIEFYWLKHWTSSEFNTKCLFG